MTPASALIVPTSGGEQHRAAGLALTAMSVGSVLGGLCYAGRTWPGSTAARFVTLQLLFGAGLSACATSVGPVSLAVLLAVAGVFVAPIAAENA